MSLVDIINITSRSIDGTLTNDVRLTMSVLFRDYLHLFKGAKLAVFVGIALHMDLRDGWAHPSLSLLKKETGYSDVGTLSAAVTELAALRIEGRRLLIVLQKKGGAGRFANNDYLIFPSDEQVAQFEAGTLVRKPRRVQPNGEKPDTAPYGVLPSTVNANRSIESSIHTESKESSIKDSAANAATPSVPLNTAQKIEAAQRGELPLTVGAARNLVADVIAHGGYGMKVGDRFTSITGNGVIKDQFGEKPTIEQITTLARDLWGMYIWWTDGKHGLSNPTKQPTVISALNQYREHLATLKPNAVSNSGGNHAVNVLGGRSSVVPPILPKPITAANLPAVRRDGDVPAGRTNGSSDVQ